MSEALCWVAGGRARGDVRNTTRDTRIVHYRD